jgi:hypothetical protein
MKNHFLRRDIGLATNFTVRIADHHTKKNICLRLVKTVKLFENPHLRRPTDVWLSTSNASHHCLLATCEGYKRGIMSFVALQKFVFCFIKCGGKHKITYTPQV